jgi:hypothetical protein
VLGGPRQTSARGHHPGVLPHLVKREFLLVRRTAASSVGAAGGTVSSQAAFKSMDKIESRKREKVARGIISRRLKEYYSELKAIIDVDTEDFFQRVIQQAKAARQEPPEVHGNSTAAR